MSEIFKELLIVEYTLIKLINWIHFAGPLSIKDVDFKRIPLAQIY